MFFLDAEQMIVYLVLMRSSFPHNVFAGVDESFGDIDLRPFSQLHALRLSFRSASLLFLYRVSL